MTGTFRLAALVLLLSLVTAACSSSSSAGGGSTVSGTVKSAALQPQSAIAVYGAVATEEVNGQVTQVRGMNILVSDKPNTCSVVHGQGSTNLAFSLPGTVAPGASYDVIDAAIATPQGGQAEADFNTADSTCQSPLAETAVKGTLSITAADASHVAGSFDVTFPDGHVTGAFDAVLCATGTGADGGAPACIP